MFWPDTTEPFLHMAKHHQVKSLCSIIIEQDIYLEKLGKILKILGTFYQSSENYCLLKDL